MLCFFILKYKIWILKDQDELISVLLIELLSTPINNMLDPFICDNHLICHNILSYTLIDLRIYLSNCMHIGNLFRIRWIYYISACFFFKGFPRIRLPLVLFFVLLSRRYLKQFLA